MGSYHFQKFHFKFWLNFQALHTLLIHSSYIPPCILGFPRLTSARIPTQFPPCFLVHVFLKKNQGFFQELLHEFFFCYSQDFLKKVSKFKKFIQKSSGISWEIAIEVRACVASCFPSNISPFLLSEIEKKTFPRNFHEYIPLKISQ